MIKWIVVTAVFTVINAFLYRFGGVSVEEGIEKYPWAPKCLFKSITRDLGISLTTIAWLLLCYPIVGQYWAYLFIFGATWGALSTYLDKIFGYDNYYAHGFLIALAKIFIVIYTGNWVGMSLYCIVTTVGMGLLSQYYSSVDVEELGRGALTTITLPLLLI